MNERKSVVLRREKILENRSFPRRSCVSMEKEGEKEAGEEADFSPEKTLFSTLTWYSHTPSFRFIVRDLHH